MPNPRLHLGCALVFAGWHVLLLELRRFNSPDHAAVLHLHRLALEATGAFVESETRDADLENIESDLQRTGFGKLLLRELERRAIAQGYRRLTLDTTERQVAAQARYRRSGYSEYWRTVIAGMETVLPEKLV